MFDSYLAVVGTALNTPERKVTKNDVAVANFRVASHARRYDKQTQQWVDGPSLRIRVTCWRRLADHVSRSILSGDAVVVYGRIATHDWVNENGEARITYELEAVSVGHDLSRGTASFIRARPEANSMVVEDPDEVGPEREQPVDDELGVVPDEDALAILAEAGITVPEPGEEDDEEEAAAHGRSRRRSRLPVPA
jgi:single-strand DNA-binding protein